MLTECSGKLQSYKQYSKEGGSRFKKKKKDNTSGQFLQKAQNKEDSITVYSI